MTSIPIRIASTGCRVRYFVEALLAIILLTIPSWIRAGVITAASTSFKDVAAGISSAKDGDTVVLPAGTTSWTSTLTVKKAITLQGAGVAQTIIKDDLSNKNGHLISITTRAGKCYRITGIEFQPGARTTVFVNGMINISGSTTSFRLDHCKFTALFSLPYIYFTGSVCGVIDHSDFTHPDLPSTLIYIYHDKWAGQSFGDGSWADTTNLGTANAMYIEDCTFSNIGTNVHGITDAYGGARWVFRHNTCSNIKVELNHGTESSGRFRGGRSTEVYQNTFTCNLQTGSNLFNQRSGTGVIWGNTSTGYNHRSWATVNNNRDNGYYSFNHYPGWQGANGLSGWDINDTTGGPNHDGIYLSGTASAGSGSRTLVMTGATWATNQWKGYVVRDTNQGYTDGNGVTWPDTFATIASNTTNTITTDAGQFRVLVINSGDHVEIRKVKQALDTIGASQCDALAIDPVPPPHDLHQTMEPIYCWNNTVDGVPATVVPTTSNVVAGVNYINGTAKPGYTPYVYPHPLVSDVPSPPKTLKPAAPKSQGRRQDVR